jgi:hypothetical protein
MFHIFQMIISNTRSYQLGGAAFTSRQGEGTVKKGIRHMVLEDTYGAQCAFTLGERMVELARIVKAGQAALPPVHQN